MFTDALGSKKDADDTLTMYIQKCENRLFY